MMPHLLIVISSWVLSLTASVLAVYLAVDRDVRHRGWVLPLSILALAIGYLGFGHGSPFQFPQIGYAWSSDDNRFHIQIASSWLFVAPLVLGGAAMALLARASIRRQ